MARHGENIRKRKDRRWEGRYSTYDEEKGKQIYHSVYGKSYEDVKEKLLQKMIEQQVQKDEGNQAEACQLQRMANQDIILTQAAEEWLTKIRETKKPSTYNKYRSVYHKYLESILRDKKVLDITQCQLTENIPASLSESMWRSISCVLHQIFEEASRQLSVAVPSLKIEIQGKQSKPVEAFNRKEQKKLFALLHDRPDRYKMAALLCLHTGLRLGEVCALKWEDIDFENQLLMVRRTVQRLSVKGYPTKTILMETEPKSSYSKREIPLSDSMLKLLTLFFPGDGREEGYVFGQDKPVEPRTMQNHFKGFLKLIQLPYRNFHILRHTFATNCIEGGVDVRSLSEILGHANVHITLNRYVHPSLETKRKYLDELSAIYGQIHGQFI